jgi:hypothetical protein
MGLHTLHSVGVDRPHIGAHGDGDSIKPKELVDLIQR